MDDIVCTRKIQSESARFQTDQEEGTLARLEVLHQLFAHSHRRAAVKVEIRQLRLVHSLLHFLKETRELAEDKSTVAAFVKALSQVDESKHLAAGEFPFPVDQRTAARHLAKAGNLRQRTHLVANIGTHPFFRFTPADFIHGHFVRRQFNRQFDFILLRQLIDDLALRSPQQEG